MEATRNGTVTRYVYDAAGNLLAEADEANTITRYYIYGLGLLAMVKPTGETYTYHYNGIGSTIAMTDQDKNMVCKYFYTAFGLLTNQEETIPQAFKYAGKHGIMYEPNGFYYMRARYYDPEVGRFISEDPIGLAGGVNLYAYAGNNPIAYIDPFGEDYVDINITGGFILGITGGVLIDSTGFYPYIGGGLVTPGIGPAIMWSPSDAESGWSVAAQGVGGVAAQGGYSFSENSSWFYEIGGGFSYPILFGASLTGYYVFPSHSWDVIFPRLDAPELTAGK